MNERFPVPRQFASVRIEPDRRRLSGAGGEASLEPLVMQLLLLLAEGGGRVVPRRELFAALWGSAPVGDASLNRLVSELRRELERTSQGALRIETVPRTGYRLADQQQDEAASRVSAPSFINRRSVISGGTAAVATMLITSAWVASRDRQHQSLMNLVDQGDRSLLDSVPSRADDSLPPLEQALRSNPYDAAALGLSALAETTLALSGGSADPSAALARAEQFLERARARDRAEPHARLAAIQINGSSLDWGQTEDATRNILRDAPANPHVICALSSLLQSAGLTGPSWRLNELAAQLRPSSPTPKWRRVLRLWTAGRTEQALEASERLMGIWPQHALVWNARFMVLAFSGRTSAARAMLRQSRPIDPASHPAETSQWLPTLAALADPTARNVASAREANLSAAQSNPGQAIYAAMALSQLGQIDDAFVVTNALLLSRGNLVTDRPNIPRNFFANAPSWCRTQWLFMPPMAAVRADPRFRELCDGLDLTRYWRERGVTPSNAIA